MAKRPLISPVIKDIIFFLPRHLFLLEIAERFLSERMIAGNQIKFWKQFVPMVRWYKRPTIRHCSRNSINYNFDLSNRMDWFNYFSMPDDGFKNLLLNLKKDFIVFDIGANIGTTVMPFAKKCETGFVYAFEPNPDTVNLLNNNLGLNNFENIEIYNLGLGNNPGNKKLYRINENNFGMDRIMSTGIQKQFPAFDITISTIDLFVKEKQIKRIDLIKIDTEGYETEIIKGGINTIREFHPLLFIELDDENLKQNGSSADELIKYLQTLNYKDIRDAETNESIFGNYDYKDCHIDIICS
jgi:FkbM family methyltransferase